MAQETESKAGQTESNNPLLEAEIQGRRAYESIGQYQSLTIRPSENPEDFINIPGFTPPIAVAGEAIKIFDSRTRLRPELETERPYLFAYLKSFAKEALDSGDWETAFGTCITLHRAAAFDKETTEESALKIAELLDMFLYPQTERPNILL